MKNLLYISAPVEVKPEQTGKSSAGKIRGSKNNSKDSKTVRSRPESQVIIIILCKFSIKGVVQCNQRSALTENRDFNPHSFHNWAKLAHWMRLIS